MSEKILTIVGCANNYIEHYNETLCNEWWFAICSCNDITSTRRFFFSTLLELIELFYKKKNF